MDINQEAVPQDVFSVFDSIGQIILLILNSILDFILGIITIAHRVAVQAVNVIPLIVNIVEYLLDLAQYAVDLFESYWKLPVVIVTLIPMYFMMFFLINRLNSLLD